MEFNDLGARPRELRPALDAAIARVLDHGRFIMGPEVTELEAALASWCGGSHVVTCASGTDALVLALRVRGVGPGDAVVVPTYTFAATAEAVALVGATPIFADIAPDTGNIDPAALEPALRAVPAGHRAVGVIAVDLFGVPADYPALAEVASTHGLWVIADAAQSFGAIDPSGTPVGRCTDLTTTSFFPSKPLGAYGDGGAVMCSSPDDAAVLRSLRVHGAGADKYDNERVGTNSRLDTLQAAVLLVKLEVFGDDLARRETVAASYGEALAPSAGIAPLRPPGRGRSAWAQYTIRVSGAPNRPSARDHLAATLAEAGIPTAVYYRRPLHLQRAFANAPRPADGLPHAERLAAEALSLPMSPSLTEADQDRVIDAVLSWHRSPGPTQ